MEVNASPMIIGTNEKKTQNFQNIFQEFFKIVENLRIERVKWVNENLKDLNSNFWDLYRNKYTLKQSKELFYLKPLYFENEKEKFLKIISPNCRKYF